MQSVNVPPRSIEIRRGLFSAADMLKAGWSFLWAKSRIVNVASRGRLDSPMGATEVYERAFKIAHLDPGAEAVPKMLCAQEPDIVIYDRRPRAACRRWEIDRTQGPILGPARPGAVLVHESPCATISTLHSRHVEHEYDDVFKESMQALFGQSYL